MADPVALPVAANLRRRGNTYKAMLADTRDFLEGLAGSFPGDERGAIFAQIEAIDEVLTGDTKPA